MAFTLQDAYPSHPTCIEAKCWFCGSSQRDLAGRREGVVNCGRDIEYEGGVFMCELCALELGRLVGMVGADRAGQLALEREAFRVDGVLQAERADAAEALLAAERRHAATLVEPRDPQAGDAIAALVPPKRTAARARA